MKTENQKKIWFYNNEQITPDKYTKEELIEMFDEIYEKGKIMGRLEVLRDPILFHKRHEGERNVTF
jgi:hypothetical protein